MWIISKPLDVLDMAILNKISILLNKSYNFLRFLSCCIFRCDFECQCKARFKKGAMMLTNFLQKPTRARFEDRRPCLCLSRAPGQVCRVARVCAVIFAH